MKEIKRVPVFLKHSAYPIDHRGKMQIHSVGISR